MTPDLVVVGAASRDLTPADWRGWRLGGSATYASLAAARLGVRVGCLLGVDEAAADAAELRALEEAGVLLRPVPLGRGPVFDNIENDGRRRQRWESESDAIPVSCLPPAWRSAGAWLLAPVAGEVRGEWSGVPVDGAKLCVGWQGLLRDFTAEGWVEKLPPKRLPLLDRAGLVCASFHDLPPEAVIEELAELAPSAAVVLTAGAHGGLVYASGGLLRYPALAAHTVDPTGAGDVFMAALVAAWLLTGKPATPRALRLAAAAGSCAVEAWGLAGVPTKEQVVARLRTAGQS